MAGTDMMIRTLENTTELGGAFSAERWAYAGKMTLLGMVMVFAVLALLWGILAIFQKVMSRGETKPTNASASASQKVAETTAASASSDDEMLAAVITSAIAAYMADENDASSTCDKGFKVVSFRRVQGGKAWNLKH